MDRVDSVHNHCNTFVCPYWERVKLFWKNQQYVLYIQRQRHTLFLFIKTHYLFIKYYK